MAAAAAIPGLVQVGETLRTAREVRGLSVEQAAATLRCDARVIDALESGRFEDLGPPVFARGHLLRYATLLGEPGEAMVEEWSQLAAGGTRAELLHGLHGPRGRDLRQVRRRLVAAAAILCVVVVAVWSLQHLPTAARAPAEAALPAAPPRQSAPTLPANPPAAPVGGTPAVAAPAPTAPGLDATEPALDTKAPSAASQPASGAVAAIATPVAPPAIGPSAGSPALPRGAARLSLAFSADSWLEIYDARNRRLFFGLARPGAPVEVQGPAPLRVIVGNAPAVTIELNGRRAEVPREAMRGPRAAALRVNADGRLLALPRA